MRRDEVFFGWWIVAAGAALLTLIGGLLLHAYGAYIVLLQREFAWSTVLLSSAFAMLRMESGLVGPLQGWLIDRYGPRTNIRGGVVMLGIGFLLFSQIQTPVQFFAAFFLMALGSSFAGFMPISVTVVCWFRRRRSLALSACVAGVSAGGLAVPLLAMSLERWGWRATAMASGVVVLVAGLALARLFHHHPSDVGQTIDGVRDDASTGESSAAAEGRPEQELTLHQTLRMPTFWLMELGHTSALFIVSLLLVHFIPYLTTTLGFTLTQASLGMLLLTLMHVTGLAAGGVLGDRVDKRLLVITCLGLHGAGLFLLTLANSWLLVAAFAVCHGLAWGIRGPTMLALRADYYGRKSYGKVLGVSSLTAMIGSTAGPVLSGVLVDVLGGYRPALRLMSLAGAIGFVAFTLARRPAPPATAEHGRADTLYPLPHAPAPEDRAPENV